MEEEPKYDVVGLIELTKIEDIQSIKVIPEIEVTHYRRRDRWTTLCGVTSVNQLSVVMKSSEATCPDCVAIMERIKR